MTKFGDAMRARFAQRAKDRAAGPPASPGAASPGAASPGAGKVPGPAPSEKPAEGPAKPSEGPAVTERPRKGRHGRQRTPRALAKEQARILNLAAIAGAFQPPIDVYFARLGAARLGTPLKQRRTPAYVAARMQRVNDLDAGILAIANGILDAPLDVDWVEVVWSKANGRPRFTVRKEKK